MVMSLKTDASALPVSVSAGVCRLSGDWNVQALSLRHEVERRRQALQAVSTSVKWDLSGVELLDAVGAQMLWQCWGQSIPPGTQLSAGQQALFKILAEHPVAPPPPAPATDWFGAIRTLGQGFLTSIDHGRMLLVLLGSLLFNFIGFVTRPVRGPWREISAQVSGPARRRWHYSLSRIFDWYRAVLSVCTTTGGVWCGAVYCQATGCRHRARAGSCARRDPGGGSFRLIDHGANWRHACHARARRDGRDGDLARAAFDFAARTRACIDDALIGPLDGCDGLARWHAGRKISAGFVCGVVRREIADAIGIKNYWIGMIKGVTFGAWIALVACHFGLRIEPNTESLGKGTTTSVVTSITGVILIDAIYAIIFNEMNI